jgi:hypothetical protein
MKIMTRFESRTSEVFTVIHFSGTNTLVIPGGESCEARLHRIKSEKDHSCKKLLIFKEIFRLQFAYQQKGG